MLIRQHDVVLDIYAIKPLITTIHCKQTEHESNQFNIRLRNGDTDYLIDEVNDKFQILFNKADGNVVESPVTTIVGTSILSYTCQGNELAFAGKVEVEVRLYREDNGGNVTELLIFPKIIITCDTIVDVTNAIQSTSQFDTLTELIDEVNNSLYTLVVIDDVTPATDKLYSSSRVEERVSDVQDAIDACYTSSETDTLLGYKANSADVYTTTVTDNLLGGKVDKVAGKGLSTEDYTSAEKTKLAGIAESANNYVHPSTHAATMIDTDVTHRFITDTELTKLGGISTGANKTEASLTNGNIKIDTNETTVYTHPSTHDATMINEDSTHRFVTDTEKSGWNAKLDSSSYTANDVLAKIITVDGTGSLLDADTLDGLEATGFLKTASNSATNNTVQIQTKDSGGTAKNIAYMTAGNLMVYGASANPTQINGTTLEHFNGTTTLKVVTIVTGTAAPAVTPNFIGQVFVDTTNKKTYRAYGTATSADWGYEGLKIVSENSTATAGQATITISLSGFSTVTDVVRVFINGIKLRPTAAYTVSGTTITLTNNYTLSAGDEIEVELIKNGA